MSRRLTEEEKRQNILQREERKRQNDLELKLNERSYTILRTLRDAPEHPEVKYNNDYFAKLFKISKPSVFRLIKDLREKELRFLTALQNLFISYSQKLQRTMQFCHLDA